MGKTIEEQIREKVSKVENVLEERENFLKLIKDNEMHLSDLCNHVNEVKTKAEKERDDLNMQIDELKKKMQSQTQLIQQLNEQVGNARCSVKTQKDQLESYLKQQQQLETSPP